MLDKSKWTIVDLVRRQAKRFGDRVFMTFEDGQALTFEGFDAESDSLAVALSRQGVMPGDRVLALVRNRCEFMLAMLATQKLGAIFVPINTELKGAFLQHQLRNAEPRVVLVDADLIGAFEGVDKGDVVLNGVVVVAGELPAALPAALGGPEAMTFSQFAARGGRDASVLIEPKPQDIGCIMYTSGTTGPSKGVLMPHAHLYLFGVGTMETLKLTDQDVYYVCMPLFHANALLMQVLGSLLAGTRVHCVLRFSPNRWLREVQECKATVTNALGVMPEFIFRSEPTPHDREHNLRHMMAVPIGKDWGQEFEERFNVGLVQGFGMTECNIPIYTRLGDEMIPGCAGYVLEEYFELRIADPETDEPLPVNEVGEIVIRPKEPSCFMAGYFRMPDRTVEAWRNLWFHTGDAGRIDEQGRVHFVDRIKDCIRRRGENISAFEVEQVLNSHPDVAESAVIGVRVEGAGGEEEVKALVVAKPGRALDNVALLDFCAERMPRYAVPRYLEHVGELDKTATGKVRKQALRDAGVTPETWDRESVGYVLARG